MEPQLLWERMAKVKPFWESVPQEDRLDLVSIPLTELKQRAADNCARKRKQQGGQQSRIVMFVIWGPLWCTEAALWTS